MNNHHSTTNKAIRLHHWVLMCFVVIGVFFLVTEHRAHAWGWLPYLLFAACPLMHLFMHKHHGSHGDNTDRDHQEHGSHHH